MFKYALRLLHLLCSVIIVEVYLVYYAYIIRKLLFMYQIYCRSQCVDLKPMDCRQLQTTSINESLQ